MNEQAGLPPVNIGFLKDLNQRLGEDFIEDKAIEEMAELTQALLKLRNHTFDTADKWEAAVRNVWEEIADVYLATLMLSVPYQMVLQDVCKNKLARLERRLKGEERW